MQRPWMLYGATGYTGRLIAQECVRRGLRPVLAARDAAGVAALARSLGLEHRAFGLQDDAKVRAGLAGMYLLLNCAGPFSATAAPLRRACIAARVHYLDITGEIDVFLAAQAQDAEARAAGVLLCPGVGFDVVPTDCVAACLKQALPDATRLALGFSGLERMSAGTAATSLEGLAQGSTRVRRGGRVVALPFGEGGRTIDFGRGPEPSFVIPWGDVATAGWSTGIPDIEVHIPARSPGARAVRSLLPLRRLLGAPAVRRLAHRLLRRLAAGPSRLQREQERVHVWGEARNAAGEVRRAQLETANGYSLTVETALLAVQFVLRQQVPAGYRTPSQLMGARCVQDVEGGGTIVVT